MSDVLFCAALLLMFVTLFNLSRQRNLFRDRANEAEFKLSLARIEIAHLKEKLEVKND